MKNKNKELKFTETEWKVISDTARMTGKRIVVFPPHTILFDGKEVSIYDLQDILYTSYQQLEESA